MMFPSKTKNYCFVLLRSSMLKFFRVGIKKYGKTVAFWQHEKVPLNLLIDGKGSFPADSYRTPETFMNPALNS